ncbi:hypothetical protein [Metallosphaera yellowstonensis]|nr:hypothetical protein [Metallosphaera yellowstonensis]
MNTVTEEPRELERPISRAFARKVNREGYKAKLRNTMDENKKRQSIA